MGCHLLVVLLQKAVQVLLRLPVRVVDDARAVGAAVQRCPEQARRTSSGWETIATWFEETSTVVAPMRLANSRSASGGIAWSPSAIRNHDGSDFQAGTPITSS